MDPLRMLREYNSALVTVANATARTGATVEDNISEAVSYGLSDSPKAQRGGTERDKQSYENLIELIRIACIVYSKWCTAFLVLLTSFVPGEKSTKFRCQANQQCNGVPIIFTDDNRSGQQQRLRQTLCSPECFPIFILSLTLVVL
ncbi:uncharacterized protein LOC111268147 isoform X1 [Varroa jacobsoni]|uniref:uncharacterized protein LOC111268147 isoform X1 n=1 Tax=Varroa jacobsoni TaxID=62625 RepID=UPI000BF29AAA|nr:uncharacterized protein LOC111268147 isoform X1 [Varroa jacobsoni]